MIERIVQIKQNSSILYYLLMILLLFPILTLIVASAFSPLVRGWLASSAKKIFNESKKKDEALKLDMQDVQKKLDVLDKQIEDVSKKIDDAKKNLDPDWNKKK